MDPTLERMIRELSQKSCGDASHNLSLLTNANLETKRSQSEFIVMLKDLSRLMQDVTMVDRADCRGEFPRFDSCGISASGACATSCLPKHSIKDSYIDYDMVKYRVAHTYDHDMLDCNQFGERISDIAMDMLMMKIKNEIERVAIMGDESLPTGDEQSDYNNLMGVNDGWLKIACSCTPDCQIIDAQGMGPSRNLFMQARKKLPTRYKANRGDYRFITGPTMNDWWAETVSNRPTDKGDAACESGEGGRIWGTNFYEVPLWPEDLPYNNGTQAVTHILYTPLSNLVTFVRRRLELESERRIECDDYLTVGYWSQDNIIAEPEAVVLIKNVDLDNCDNPWNGCTTKTCPNVCGDEANTNNPAC